MTTIVLSIGLAALAGLNLAALRRARVQQLRLEDMAERLREMCARFEAAEADVAHAVTRADIAEALLVEKGVADEEDIEEIRRRFIHGDEAPPAESGHEGELH